MIFSAKVRRTSILFSHAPPLAAPGTHSIHRIFRLPAQSPPPTPRTSSSRKKGVSGTPSGDFPAPSRIPFGPCNPGSSVVPLLFGRALCPRVSAGRYAGIRPLERSAPILARFGWLASGFRSGFHEFGGRGEERFILAPSDAGSTRLPEAKGLFDTRQTALRRNAPGTARFIYYPTGVVQISFLCGTSVALRQGSRGVTEGHAISESARRKTV
jgi:hypothetical protein